MLERGCAPEEETGGYALVRHCRAVAFRSTTLWFPLDSPRTYCVHRPHSCGRGLRDGNARQPRRPEELDRLG